MQRLATTLLLLCAAACSASEAGDDDGAAPPDAAPAPLDEIACEGSTVYRPPADPTARGAWPVGARTVTVSGLTTEVWYPARRGSESGAAPARYDLRLHMPESERAKIPDADNPWQPCDCFRDLPLDDAHGPYPVVVFAHGTAGFRSQTLTQMTHWASRGFVVVAADHPGLELADVMQFQFGGDQAGDVRTLLGALADPAASGDAGLGFLAGRIDAGRIGLVGHSAGGGAIAGLGAHAGVRVVIPMASRGSGAGTASTLVMGGMEDGIAQYSAVKMGFEQSPPRRRLVGLADAGHLTFSDLCAIGADRGGLLQIALDHGVEVNQLIAGLARDGCEPGQLAPETGWAIINHATSLVLEEALLCATPMPGLNDLQARFPAVAELEEDL